MNLSNILGRLFSRTKSQKNAKPMRSEKMAFLATLSSVSKVPAQGRYYTDIDTHISHTHTLSE